MFPLILYTCDSCWRNNLALIISLTFFSLFLLSSCKLLDFWNVFNWAALYLIHLVYLHVWGAHIILPLILSQVTERLSDSKIITESHLKSSFIPCPLHYASVNWGETYLVKRIFFENCWLKYDGFIQKTECMKSCEIWFSVIIITAWLAFKL